MREFDECKGVYSTYYGGIFCMVMPLAFAVVCLAAISFILSLFGEVLDYGVGVVLTIAVAPVAFLPLLKLRLRQRHTKAGVCADGLLLQNWRRRVRFVPWEKIRALVETVERLPLAGELCTGCEDKKYVLAIHVRTDDGTTRPVWIALCGFGSKIAAWQEIDKLRDEIIHNCGLKLASDRELGCLTLLWTVNRVRRKRWKVASCD
jgi:hypothetical protein